MPSIVASPVLGRFLELLGYTAKTARYFYPENPMIFFADLASERLLKTHTSALQNALRKEGQVQSESKTRSILVEELAILEKTLAARQQVTEERLIALLQSALRWEAEGGRVDITEEQQGKLSRADRAFDDLLLAAQMLQSTSVQRCAIEFADATPLRFLKWLFFPPRTLLLGEAFEGVLEFQDCLPPGQWTNDFIRIAHSVVGEADSAPYLQLTAEYVWADPSPRPKTQLELASLTSQPKTAQLSRDRGQETLDATSEDVPATLRFGEAPKTLLLPVAVIEGRASAVRLRALPQEPPLRIYQLKPKPNNNDV